MFHKISAIVSFALACCLTPQLPAQDTATSPSADRTAASERLPIPDRLVVLTFDDSSKSHYSIVRPLLKEYGFGATFFITEGFDFKDNQRDYMTWPEIAELHRDGFEIGNHTRDHLAISDATATELDQQLRGIEERCTEYGIPEPITFAWPGNATSLQAFDTLRQHGIQFARRGGAPEYPYEDGNGFAFEAGLDHPLLLPSAGDARPNWTLANFTRAVEQAKQGRIAIVQFHGAPDTAHDWVSTQQQNFAAFMKYLKLNDFQVIALRDLRRFTLTDSIPADPQEIIRSRQAELLKAKPEVSR